MTQRNLRKRKVSRWGSRQSLVVQVDEMPKSELCDLPVQLLAETDKAWKLSDGIKTDWFPKSQCELEPNKDSTYTLTVPAWLLLDKKWDI